MKKIVAFILPAILLASFASAQPINIGIRGGLGIPNIAPGGAGTPVSEGYKSRLAAGAGIFTEMEFSKLFSLRLGVEYSGQGGKKDGMQAMPSSRLISGIAANMPNIDENMAAIIGEMASRMPKYVYADIKNKAAFDYLMIPVMAQFGWDLGANSPWRVYINAGPFVSFLMGGNQISSGIGTLYTSAEANTSLWNSLPTVAQDGIIQNLPELAEKLQNPFEFGTIDITGELRPVNFGFCGNAGLSYRYKRSRFFVEFGGNYGLIKVQKNTDNGANRIGSGSAMIGYAFNLIK
ncbi:MAG: PorT family protein [Prevotellaceae bacterium]|jgi:hypothetical protein|nr:PorT family protein [Prevotellaceae bacterium]